MRKQRVRKASTDYLKLRPTEGPPETYTAGTPPVSVGGTLAIYDVGGAVIRAAATVSPPVLETTLSASASDGASTVTLTSVTGLKPGHQIWIGTTGTESQDCRTVTAINTSTKVVTVNRLLQFAHANGQKVITGELKSALTAIETATLDQNYRALWTYKVGGETLEATQLFDVVLHLFKLPITPADISVIVPDSLLRAATDVTHEQILDAVEEDIIGELDRRSLRADRIRGLDRFRRLGEIGVRRLLLERNALVDPAGFSVPLKEAKIEWTTELGIVCEEIDWYDEDEDDATEETDDETGIPTEERRAAPRYLRFA